VHAQRVRRVARERDVETKPRLRLVGRGGQGGDEDKALPSGEVGFEVVLSVEKDKRQGPGWNQVEVFRGPTGIG
jgi:hypothetical protein